MMRDLRAHDVEMLTIGQYLAPSAHHLPVARYAHLERVRDGSSAKHARSASVMPRSGRWCARATTPTSRRIRRACPSRRSAGEDTMALVMALGRAVCGDRRRSRATAASATTVCASPRRGSDRAGRRARPRARRQAPQRQAAQGEGATRQGRGERDLGDLEPGGAHGARRRSNGSTRTYRDKGLEVVALSIDERPGEVREFWRAARLHDSRWRCAAMPSSTTTAASPRRRCSTSWTARERPAVPRGRPGDARQARSAPQTAARRAPPAESVARH